MPNSCAAKRVLVQVFPVLFLLFLGAWLFFLLPDRNLLFAQEVQESGCLTSKAHARQDALAHFDYDPNHTAVGQIERASAYPMPSGFVDNYVHLPVGGKFASTRYIRSGCDWHGNKLWESSKGYSGSIFGNVGSQMQAGNMQVGHRKRIQARLANCYVNGIINDARTKLEPLGRLPSRIWDVDYRKTIQARFSLFVPFEGRGKGPQLKTNARSDKGPRDWR
jgi:hypothetical protein